MPEKPDHISLFYVDYVSREIKVGDLLVGGNNPVRIQSMTNTSTSDVPATVNQIKQLVSAGCDIVRLAVQNKKEAEILPVIKRELKKSGIAIPLVADIHFRPEFAEIAARYVEKVRINPGNYIDRQRGKTDYTEMDDELALERISERLRPLIEICKREGTAIRIGVNHGSLSERILIKYGNTPEGMVESAMEFIRVCRREGFDNLTLSLKASHVLTMIEANRMFVERMKARGYDYPVHLGVTEAGSGEEARMKSITGIGSLLASGIG
ncbi:MAG: (E)-4-hydroxy-3-methylbut-2-enyl-diphosphate synthase, partial [Chlorobi bacterium]|nr:(E)-4-hydroxy-3-methylbut-2-enyl-diphosphate synthase [Chlorobiota bacterium]